MRRTVTAALTGAAAMYFLDPDRGRGRRTRTRDRTVALLRRTGRRVGRVHGHVASDVHGLRQRLAHPVPDDLTYNDATLAQKVRSELFAGREIPKEKVVINAEHGVIVLRGELVEAREIQELVRAAADIPGVRGVRSLLHLADTPPRSEQNGVALAGRAKHG